MEKGAGKNEMANYLEKKGKPHTGKYSSSRSTGLSKIKSRGLALINMFKKVGYKMMKITIFAFFVYSIERSFYRMRVHIAKNGGLRKDGYQAM